MQHRSIVRHCGAFVKTNYQPQHRPSPGVQLLDQPVTRTACLSTSSNNKARRNFAARSIGIGIGSLMEEVQSSQAQQWHPLEPVIWQGTEAEAMSYQNLPQTLSPAWKVILLSDGSVTRHLKLMTSLDVKVECLQMQDLAADERGLPKGVEKIAGPLLQRQVFLRRPDQSEQQNGSKLNGEAGPGKILVYATSWWNATAARQILANTEQPIWTSISGTELRREIQYVCLGDSAYLERQLGVKGPFWGRQYVFYHDGGKPLTVIYEVFSPALEEYLGPMYNQRTTQAMP